MPAGYRPGVPQQPYSKYESDNEEIRVEYKRVDSLASGLSVRNHGWLSGYKGAVLRILLFVVVFLLGLILGYIVRRSVKENGLLTVLQPCSYKTTQSEDYNYEATRELNQIIKADSIKEHLSRFSSIVHITGTSGNNQLRELLENRLQELRLNVRHATYKALLSYQDWERRSSISLLDGNGSLVYETDYRGPILGGPGFRAADHPELTEPYVAYSANGTFEGEPVYANYGEEKDFSILEKQGVRCEGRVVIMRYGRISVSNMVSNAQHCGAAAVLLYPDPSDVTDDDVTPGRRDHREGIYPEGSGLPGWANRRDSLWRFGDPLSPDLPSKEGLYRLDISESPLPNILVQPISYDDASKIMLNMKGPIENEFIGDLPENVTYRMGPGYNEQQQNWRVRMETFNELETRDITNTFGIITGKEEPDRYIILGCHYDTWTYSAADTSSGVAVLMEVAKALSQLSAKGWQPKRTIILAFWDAGLMGQIGSYEWVEDHSAILSERTVAYINLDQAVTGTYTLDVESSAMLRDVIINATKRVSSLDDERKASDQSHSSFTNEYSSDRGKSVYDWWKQRSPSDVIGNYPRMKSISPDSDHAAFVYQLGVPVIWPRLVSQHYVTSGTRPLHPAHHTSIDSLDYLNRFIDPGFKGHVTLTKVVAELVLELSSRSRIGLDVREMAEWLENEYNALQQDGMQEFKSSLYHLQRSIGIFAETADIFQDNLLHLDVNNDILELRQYNDRVMRVSRAFIHPTAYNSSLIRNLLIAPSQVTSYKYSTFTAVRDTFSAYLKAATPSCKQRAHSLVEKQISLLTQAIRSANQLLADGDDVFQ